MKLSMWILNSELGRKYETVPLIMDGEMDLENARLFLGGETGKEGRQYVYVGKASDFFMGRAPDVILASGRDMLLVRHEDILEVLHDVLLIFDKYREFEQKLIRAGMGDNPFQAMLDVIHELFQCPMFCGQKDLRILALTEQYSDDQVYDGWEEVKKYHTMPIKLINTTVAPDMKKYPESIPTVAIPVSPNENKHFKYQVRSNIYCDHELWGHLYLYYNHPYMPVSVIQLARFCADAYGRLLDRLVSAKGLERHKRYTFLAELLDGKTVEKEKLENLAWQMKWPDGQRLRLYRVKMGQTGSTELFFDFVYETLDKAAQNEIVFIYGKQVLVIAKDMGRQFPELFLQLQRVLSSDRYCCGVSYPFSDLRQLSCSYFQAGFALEKLSQEQTGCSVSYYDDYAFAGLISFVRQSVEYRAFVSPSLLKLYELDRVTGTEYYKTLFWFLVNNCHSAETAKFLYIHRNTLKYRIDKITQLIDEDIYDSETGAFLHFCYAMMLEDYPLDIPRKEPDNDRP